MGVPIPNYKDEPLKRRKGFFGIRSTSAVVGSRPSEVFTDQPQCWSLFHPLLAFPGNILCNTWDVTLHFIYGPLRSGGSECPGPADAPAPPLTPLCFPLQPSSRWAPVGSWYF